MLIIHQQGHNSVGILHTKHSGVNAILFLLGIDGFINYSATTTSTKIKGVTKVYFDNPFKKQPGNRLAIWFPVKTEIEQLLAGYSIQDQSGVLDHPSGMRVTEEVFIQLGKDKSIAFVEQLVDLIAKQYR
jgi:hypothetical protein